MTTSHLLYMMLICHDVMKMHCHHQCKNKSSPLLMTTPHQLHTMMLIYSYAMMICFCHMPVKHCDQCKTNCPLYSPGCESVIGCTIAIYSHRIEMHCHQSKKRDFHLNLRIAHLLYKMMMLICSFQMELHCHHQY